MNQNYPLNPKLLWASSLLWQKTPGSAILSRDMSYHSPWKWSYLQQQWSCHMGLVLLLPPVAEVPVFPSDSLPPRPLPPAVDALPPPPSTCSPSSGWVWAGLLQTRAPCHPAPPPSHPPTTSTSPGISLFSFVQPILLCTVWFTQAWETCDHSAGYQELQAASVFGGGGREGTRKTIWHKWPTIRTFCTTWEYVDSTRRHWLKQECVSN